MELRPLHLRTFVELFGPPIVAWIAALAFLLVIGTLVGRSVFTTDPWSRGDGYLYLDQARQGPTLFHCDASTPYKPDEWCGNAGWMPAYPLLIRGLATLGFARSFAGVLLSALFHVVALVLVWSVVRRVGSARGMLALFLAAFSPGMPYAHAVSPISAIQLAMLSFVLAVAAERYLRAGVSAMFASGLHATGVFMAPVSVAVFAASWRTRPEPRVPWQGLIVPALAMVGLAAAFLFFRVTTGRWNAFFLIQEKYGHALTWPWNGLAGSYTLNGTELKAVAIAAQTSFAVVLVVAMLVVAWRSRHDVLTLPVVLVVLAFWLGPLSLGSNVAFYRTEALLLPAVLILARGPAWMLGVLLVSSSVIEAMIATVFFREGLI